MPHDLEAAALAEHLDAINRRVRESDSASGAASRMMDIMAAHEAACAALRRAEAEAELDAITPAPSVGAR